MTIPIKVEQVDREAAAERLCSVFDGSPIEQTQKRILAGKMDNHPWAQAFARHRITAEAKTREEDARIADEVELQQDNDLGAANTGGAAEAATAIRSRIPEIKA